MTSNISVSASKKKKRKPHRRENISQVPGCELWRQRARPFLTPGAVRRQMRDEGKLVLTALDRFLTAYQADALERWAVNEELLSGKVSTQDWGNAASGGCILEYSPISDHRIGNINAHMAVKKNLDDWMLQALSAFTAIQNKHQDALSPAQYALSMGLNGKDKGQAFFQMLSDVADVLCSEKY